MARQLVPIKVKIGLKSNGNALYPDFNKLQTVADSGMDWAKYIDIYGLGWHYDKVSGHKEETTDSPFGQQWGALIVPPAFADEAIAMYPETTSKLTEAELEDFYNTKAHAHEPDENIDTDILAGIKAKQDLGLSLTADQQKALDPDDHTVRGIVKNRRKRWVDYKTLVGVTIK